MIRETMWRLLMPRTSLSACFSVVLAALSRLRRPPGAPGASRRFKRGRMTILTVRACNCGAEGTLSLIHI
eukprot:5640476-Alexandrium_andersonii.AAC.1